MAQSKLYPVVMAGGSGSRLWPLSRVLYPKQFLCLKGDLTMLQTTICRLNGVECESPVVICNEQHRFIVAEQLRQLNKLTENIILEPAGRNTAPAIALAALAAPTANRPTRAILPWAATRWAKRQWALFFGLLTTRALAKASTTKGSR